jgi:hypothetical protein
MKIYENILEKTTIEFITNWVESQKTQPCWRTNILSWDDSIADKSIGCVSILDLKNNIDLYEHLYSELQNLCTDDYDIYSILYYEWNALSQINWHKDGHPNNRKAITVYLNSYWNRDWGGFLCWNEESSTSSKYQMYVPEYNTAVLIEPNIYHHVSIISPYAPPRKTLQVWMHKK